MHESILLHMYTQQSGIMRESWTPLRWTNMQSENVMLAEDQQQERSMYPLWQLHQTNNELGTSARMESDLNRSRRMDHYLEGESIGLEEYVNIHEINARERINELLLRAYGNSKNKNKEWDEDENST